MTTVNVGSILTVGYANWVDQYPIELTGTVGVGHNPADYQLYLGPSASSVQNKYADGYCYITFSGMGSPTQSLVTAYDATTKIATVQWTAGDKNPPIGRTWKLFNRFPIQRQFRWYRDGVQIPNVYADIYTVQNADAGKTITVKEIAGFIPPSSTGPVLPSIVNTATSAGVFVNPGSSDPGLIGPDNISYVGSFRIPTTYPNATGYYCQISVRGVSVIPPAYSKNGRRALLMTGLVNGTFSQLQIPADSELRTPVTTPNWESLPYATMIYPGQGSTQPGMSNVAINRAIADGLDPLNGSTTTRAQHIPGTNKFLFTLFSFYSYQGLALTYRANLDFNPASVEGPVIVADPVKQGNSRVFAGGTCVIPQALQSAFGGDLIASNALASVLSNNSDGPALLTFSSSDFSAALAKSETGVARGGTSNTIQLAANAAGTTADYYKGFWIKTADNAEAMGVSSYDPSTKTITVYTGIHPFNPVPTNGTAYKLIPPLAGNALVAYQPNEFAVTESGVANPVYTWANGICHAVLPSGTRSVLCCGFGPQGVFLYGGNLKPDNNLLMRIYDPINAAGVGPHQSVSAEDAGFKVWAYDTDTLLQAKANNTPIGSIKPYGIFKFYNPYGNLGLPTGAQVQSFTYDQETGRLYVILTVAYGSAPAVCHVYQITA